MKVTRKLVLVIGGVIACIIALDAFFQLRREVALFEDDMALDETAMGQTVRVALETTAAEAGLAAARVTLDLIRASQSRVDLRWVWLDEASSLDQTMRAALGRGDNVRLTRTTPANEERQFNYVPLRIDGPRPAALELSEPLRPQRAFLRRTELQILGTLVGLLCICGIIAAVLGMVLIGRPLQQLMEQARRIGVGDLSRRLGLRRQDEIGDLAREVDAMCDALSAARERIATETDARIAAIEQLRHADRLKTIGQLASGVAHELGTPLNVVGGYAKQIESGRLDAAEVKAHAHVVGEQVKRMTTITRQLLDFARRPRGNDGLVDLNAVVAGVTRMLSGLSRARKATISLAPADEPCWVRCDAVQLEQALTNVLVNAVHAMPAGGPIDVRIGRPSRMRSDAAPGRAYWSVVVEDRGVGIAAADLPHVFDPFFTTKAVGEGTGLGLAVAHGIVTEQGGWIDATSTPGRGSRFEVVLAAETAPTPTGDAAPGHIFGGQVA